MRVSLEHLKEEIKGQYVLMPVQEAMKTTFSNVRIEQKYLPHQKNSRFKISAQCCGKFINYQDSGFGYEDRVKCPRCGRRIAKLSSPHSSPLARDLLIHWHEMDSETEFEAFWETFGENIWYVPKCEWT
ncbi:hypothetical protein ACFL27_00215 [candidate division CSSED10-310 bacterium]|uniref:Uncharacterized protein n=1 Tax=candidate division CSSED10-310 bacterium TaxID=2855610 RepID=A0ABV6YQX3_UNCC1